MEESDEYEMELGQSRENALETDQGKKYLLKKLVGTDLRLCNSFL